MPNESVELALMRLAAARVKEISARYTLALALLDTGLIKELEANRGNY